MYDDGGKLMRDGIGFQRPMQNIALYDGRPWPKPTGWGALACYHDDWPWSPWY